LRAGLAVVAGRAAGALSRRLHLGGGTSIVGVVAQRMYPEIVEHLATQLEHGSVIVTGTNGKTTTSSFIAAIMRDVGLSVWHNREGSNMMRGVASSLVIRALPNGKLRRSGRAISILEVDEATLPQVVQAIPPRVLVFTNLFRDQLDRYGEVDSVSTRWEQAIATLPADTTLVLNADDPAIARLGELFDGPVLYYGIDDLGIDLLAQQSAPQQHQVIDTRNCPHCGSDYIYDARFYSHMGHYRCPNCGWQRPQPDVRAVEIQTESFDRQRIQIVTATEQRDVIVPLPGLYNIYNALAAVTAAQALHVDWEPIISGIEQSKPVFGRGERVQVEGRTVRLLLAKNPTGFNEVLRTLFSNENSRHVLFVLNDNIADGQDISWIWDVDFERVVGNTQTVAVAGTRARDLALRLKYAGLAQEDMTIVPPAPLRVLRQESASTARGRGARRRGSQAEETRLLENNTTTTTTVPPRVYGLKNALDIAVEQTPVGDTLFVVPTYTGLLEIHHELEQRGLTQHYWEGRDA
jgi:UDP-N-acetylmuramyl tripeptide synthase